MMGRFFIMNVARTTFRNRQNVLRAKRYCPNTAWPSGKAALRTALREPLIAEAFHRTGAVEIWGRGTNRVIAECKEYGIAPPVFEERQGFLVVSFWARLGETSQATAQVTAQVTGGDFGKRPPDLRVSLPSRLAQL